MPELASIAEPNGHSRWPARRGLRVNHGIRLAGDSGEERAYSWVVHNVLPESVQARRAPRYGNGRAKRHAELSVNGVCWILLVRDGVGHQRATARKHHALDRIDLLRLEIVLGDKLQHAIYRSMHIATASVHLNVCVQQLEAFTKSVSQSLGRGLGGVSGQEAMLALENCGGAHIACLRHFRRQDAAVRRPTR